MAASLPWRSTCASKARCQIDGRIGGAAIIENPSTAYPATGAPAPLKSGVRQRTKVLGSEYPLASIAIREPETFQLG